MTEHRALQGLYPFLHGDHQDAAKLDAALLESIAQKAQASIDAKRTFFADNAAAVVAAAVNLVADTAMMTAVGNDVGFAHIYVRQLVAQARRGDGLIGVSTSGNSDNLLAAFAKAREMGVVTIGLAGHDGGKMAAPGALDHCLVVPSDSIHRIQETHVAIYHILWDLVHTLLADERGSLSVPDAAERAS